MLETKYPSERGDTNYSSEKDNFLHINLFLRRIIGQNSASA